MKKHKIAAVALYNDNKEILLQLRAKDDSRYPSLWGLFGGHIDENENPKEAVLRETKEELDYELKDPRFIDCFDINDRYGGEIVYVFSERYDPSKPLSQHEGADMRWFSLEEIKKLRATPRIYEVARAAITE